MRAFIPVPGGWASELEPVELRLIGRVVADTAELLGERFADAFFPVGIDPSSVPRMPEDVDEDSGDGDDDEDDVDDVDGDDRHESAAEGDPDRETEHHPSGDDAGTGADDADTADFDALIAAQGWDRADDEEPRDPALARLLPPASVDDDELATEMRRLTQGDLRATKVEHLRTIYETLAASRGIVLVREGRQREWLAAMTDVRLVLASRLGIDTDADAEAVYERAAGQGDDDGVDDFESALTSLYAAMTWWQESLLEAMSRRSSGD